MESFKKITLYFHLIALASCQPQQEYAGSELIIRRSDSVICEKLTMTPANGTVRSGKNDLVEIFNFIFIGNDSYQVLDIEENYLFVDQNNGPQAKRELYDVVKDVTVLLNSSFKIDDNQNKINSITTYDQFLIDLSNINYQKKIYHKWKMSNDSISFYEFVDRFLLYETVYLNYTCFASFENGKLDGDVKLYNNSGNKKGQLIVEETYRKGKREGVSKIWYANGQLKAQLPFRNGVLEGYVKHWYPNGELRSSKKYKNGVKNGFSKKWYSSGKMYSKALYKNNILEGEFKKWDDDGTIEIVDNYTNGIKHNYSFDFLPKSKLEPSFKTKKEENKITKFDHYDEQSKIYSNYLYGVGFNAPDNWDFDQGFSEHTIYRGYDSDSAIKFVINVQELIDFNKNNSISSWTNFDENKSVVYETTNKIVKGQTNENIKNFVYEKTHFSNHKAVKIQYVMKRKELDYSYEIVKTSLSILRENKIYTLGLDVPKVYYDRNKKYYDDLFREAFFTKIN
jgi:antitoxin component YwqK of YwqJK toxin-antitoxin module